MMMTSRVDRRALADSLGRRVLEGPGETDTTVRQAVADRAAGGPPVNSRYDVLACQIGDAAHSVIDEQVAGVLRATGREKAAFEVIAAAAVGGARKGTLVIEWGTFRWTAPIVVD